VLHASGRPPELLDNGNLVIYVLHLCLKERECGTAAGQYVSHVRSIGGAAGCPDMQAPGSTQRAMLKTVLRSLKKAFPSTSPVRQPVPLAYLEQVRAEMDRQVAVSPDSAARIDFQWLALCASRQLGRGRFSACTFTRVLTASTALLAWARSLAEGPTVNLSATSGRASPALRRQQRVYHDAGRAVLASTRRQLVARGLHCSLTQGASRHWVLAVAASAAAVDAVVCSVGGGAAGDAGSAGRGPRGPRRQPAAGVDSLGWMSTCRAGWP